ncbi:hypothetical protein GP486_005292, partial [Trichoglossum hirsutum]
MNFSQSPQQQDTTGFQANIQSQLYYANPFAQQQAAQRQQQALQQTHQQQQYGGGNLATTGAGSSGSMMRGSVPQPQMG